MDPVCSVSGIVRVRLDLQREVVVVGGGADPQGPHPTHNGPALGLLHDYCRDHSILGELRLADPRKVERGVKSTNLHKLSWP